jgi:hypothetical protein
MTWLIIILVIIFIILPGILILILNCINRHDLLKSISAGWSDEEIDAIPTNEDAYRQMNEDTMRKIVEQCTRNENGTNS